MRRPKASGHEAPKEPVFAHPVRRQAVRGRRPLTAGTALLGRRSCDRGDDVGWDSNGGLGGDLFDPLRL